MSKQDKIDRITYIILAVIVGLNLVGQLHHLAAYHRQVVQTVPVTEFVGQLPAEPSRGTPRVLLMEATAYCETGLTKSGSQAGPGTVAVDPEVIPLGTRLYVEGYGPAVAADSGRLIVGNRIDVWIGDREACLAWGRRSVEVTVIGEE